MNSPLCTSCGDYLARPYCQLCLAKRNILLLDRQRGNPRKLRERMEAHQQQMARLAEIEDYQRKAHIRRTEQWAAVLEARWSRKAG